MSFKIFSYQLLGKIKPVEKIELKRKILYEDYLQFLKVKKSDELTELDELNKFVNSSEFLKKKEKIKKLSFRGSKEEILCKEYDKLRKNRDIIQYDIVKNSIDLKRFEKILNSEKLKEYFLLMEYVNNGKIKRQYEECKIEKYEGSEEEKKEKQYIKLKSNPGVKIYCKLNDSGVLKKYNVIANSEKLRRFFELKNLSEKNVEEGNELKNLSKDSDIVEYLKFEGSKEFKLYHDVLESYDLKKFQKLKEEVESDNFKNRVDYLRDRKKFQKTEAFQKQERFKKFSADEDIKFFLKYKKSKKYQKYLRISDSEEFKRFNELSELVLSDKFVNRKKYLEDAKKWEKSKEYEAEQRYFELKNSPQIVKFLGYKGTDIFSFFEKWDLSFCDMFHGEKLDHTKWTFVRAEAQKALGRNFSLPGDMHYYTEGENIDIRDKLIIETRKSKVDGMVWQMPAGFVSKKFDYSSGYLSTANSFWQEDGIWEAKVLFNPEKEVVSSCVLHGEKSSPRVNLLEMGIKNRIGIAYTGSDGKIVVDGLDISNLKRGRWYIFSVEKEKNIFVWRINDVEVLRVNCKKMDYPLYMDLFTMVIDEIKRDKLPVKFKVQWIKCYKKR